MYDHCTLWSLQVCVCVRACVCACVCVRARVCVCADLHCNNTGSSRPKRWILRTVSQWIMYFTQYLIPLCILFNRHTTHTSNIPCRSTVSWTTSTSGRVTAAVCRLPSLALVVSYVGPANLGTRPFALINWLWHIEVLLGSTSGCDGGQWQPLAGRYVGGTNPLYIIASLQECTDKAIHSADFKNPAWFLF